MPLLIYLLLLPMALASPDFSVWANRKAAPAPHPERAADYRFAAQHFQEIDRLIADHPEMITPFVVGHSLERRPIWGFRIARPGEVSRRKILVFSQLHALEWICLLYTSPSPRDATLSRMPSSA